MRRQGKMALALGFAAWSCGDDLPTAPAWGSAGLATTGQATSETSASETSEPPRPAAREIPDPSPVEESLRFIALGDSGEGNENQLAVARAAEIVCAERGCDFAMLLGDNFYDVGVSSVQDVQFVDKFETVYDGLDMPFYIVLGNHDYGPLALDWPLGDYQVDYGKVNDKWVMPDFWYTFTSSSGSTQFFAMDTPRIMFNHQLEEQRAWMKDEVAASSAPWKIGFAHHPYLSNGQHGNAGNYEGLQSLTIVNGTYVKRFVDDLVCGKVQVYISGHDHNRQVFDPVCGTYFLVSGAASKTTGFVNRDDNPPSWGDDQRPGFVWAEIEDDVFTAAFYDLDANLDHEMSFTL